MDTTTLDPVKLPEKLEGKLAKILIDNIDCMAFLLNPNTQEIVVANKQAMEAGAVPGNSCYKAWGQQEGPCPWCLAPKVKESGKKQHLEFEDQGIIWDAYWIPITKNLYLHYAFNITDRKNALQNLKDSEEIFRNLAEQSLMGICIVQDDKIQYANQGLSDIFGYSNEEMINWHLGEFIKTINPEYRETVLDQVYKKQRGMKDVMDHYEVKCINKKGENIWIDIFSKSIQYQEEIADFITLIDITGRKKMEKKFKKSRNYSKSLIESMKDGVSILDTEGVHIDVNPAFCKMTGFSREELIGSVPPHLYWPKEEYEHIEAAFQKTLRGEFNDFELVFMKKNGERFPVIVSPANILDEDGNTINYFATVKDITERKKSELELQKRKFDLGERIKELTCLYKVSKISEQMEISLNQFFTNILEHFIPAWQYPDITCARIIHNEQEFKTDNFKETKWSQEAAILESDMAVGSVEVNYLEQMPESDEGPFLKEERDLINALAGLIGRFIERKKVEEQINYQATLIEKVTDAIISTDLEFNIISWNKAAESMYGWHVDNVIGKKFTEVVPQEFLHDTRDNAIKNLIENGFWRGEVIQTNKDGEKINVLGSVTLIKDASGEPIGAVTVNRDITEQKHIEQQLSASEGRFKTLYENAPLSYQSLDYRGNILEVNKTWLDFLGYTKEEVIGKWFGDFIDREYLKVLQARFPKFKEEGEVSAVEYELIKKDGSRALVSFNGKIGYDKKGEFKQTHSIFQDITERKRSENKLRLNSEIMTNLAEGINLVRVSDLKIIWVNSIFEEMFGYEPGEMIGKDINIVNAPTDKTPKETSAEIAGDLEKTGVWHGEINNIKKDGTPFWCFVNISVFDHPEYGEVLVSVHTDITERKISEQKLKESEIKFRLAFENAADAIIWADSITGEIINCNIAAEKLIECGRDEIIGQHHSFLYPPEDREFITKRVKKISEAGETIEFEAKLLSNSGKIIPIQAKTSNTMIGKTPIRQAIFRDITERKKTQEEIIELNEFYQNVLDGIINGVWVTNKDDVIFYANDGMGKIAGIKPKEIEGARVLIDFPESVIEYFKPHYLKAKETLKPTYYDSIPVKTPAGRQSYQSGWLIPIIKNGTYDGMICTVDDVTARKKAELDLRKSEEKVQNLVNNISDVLIEIGIDGIITFLSPQISSITGYQPSELIERDLLKLAHPEDKIILKPLGKSREILNLEFRIKHKDGYFVPVAVKGTLVMTDGNLKIIGVLSDVTERRRVEAMIKLEVKQLKELERIRTDLINRISHEFNTPLISIMSGSDLLLSHYKDKIKDDVSDIIDIIYKGGYRLKDMVDNLILTFKIDSSELKIIKVSKNIVPIIKDCVDNVLSQAHRRDVLLNLELHPELILNLDESLIYKAILNVITNAIKNTPSRGNVFVKSIDHKNYIEIIVEDTGVGLTKKEIPLLFKKFGKIERYGKKMDINIEGPGLGLYITNEIVKLHKGEVLVRSKGRNKGSKFTIRLFKK